MKKYLAIDVGGTAIKYGLLDENYTILYHSDVPTPRDSLDHLLDAFRKIWEEFQDEACGVGISFTATMDSTDRGYSISGSLEHICAGLYLDEVFQPIFPVPMTVENDGNCAALAECRVGSLRGCGTGIAIVLGTGIGGGIVINGQLHRGYRDCAGEFSYIYVNYSPMVKWATLNGRVGLAPEYEKLTGKECPDGKAFFQLVDAKDPEALQVLDIFTKHLSREIFNLQCILAPEIITIGGGISRNPHLMESLTQNLDAFYSGPLSVMPRAEVKLSTFLSEGNLIGAVCDLRERKGI